MENNAQLLKGVLEYCVLKLIAQEPTSHTAVRTDRYTTVQPHKCKDS